MIIASLPSKRRSYAWYWLLGSTTRLPSTPCPRIISDAESTMWDFWKTFYRVDETSALKSLVPPKSLFEFYNRDVGLPMKQKSFMFASVTGVGASMLFPASDSRCRALRLIDPINREMPFDQETLDYLSAWHYLYLRETIQPPAMVNHLLCCLTTRDRQQYLREADTFASVDMLEYSRWYYLDAAGEATVRPVKELLTTILVDMSMLLNLIRVPCPPDNPPFPDEIAKNLVPCLALIVLGSIGESDIRLAYFFVQQAFQMIRCSYFLTHPKESTVEEAMKAVLRSKPPELSIGLRRFLWRWPPKFQLPEDLAFEQSAIWPLLVDPFKMHGCHSLISKGIPFMLHPSLCTWEIDTETTSMAANSHLAALETYVLNTFSELPLPPKDHPPYRTYTTMGGTSALPKHCLRTIWSWVTTRPYKGTGLLAAAPWVTEDPWMVGVRSRLATAITFTLCPDGPAFLMHNAKTIQRFHEKLARINGTMVTLALMLPTCFCHLKTDEDTSLLSDFPDFAVPIPSEGDGRKQGYDPEEIPNEQVELPPVTPLQMRLRRILEERQKGTSNAVSLHPPQKSTKPTKELPREPTYPKNVNIAKRQTKRKPSTRSRPLKDLPLVSPEHSDALASELPKASEAPNSMLISDVPPTIRVAPLLSAGIWFHYQRILPIGTVSVDDRPTCRISLK